MSWFRHRPKAKNPNRLQPYKSSPISEKILQNIKEEVRKPSDLSQKAANKE